jgi:hypothetical protein
MKNLVEELHRLFDSFKSDATSHVEKANKAAGTRARKTSLAIEKSMKNFRKKSIEASKSKPKPKAKSK